MTEKEARRLRVLIIAVAFAALVLLSLFFRRGEAAPRPDYYVAWISERNGKEVYLSKKDWKLLCTTVWCEAGNQTVEAQRLVAVTILNRVGSDYFPDSLSKVIYQGNGKQFNVVKWPGFPEAYSYTEDTELACYLALATYPEEPANMLFFRSGYYFSNYSPYTSDGDMYFSLRE
jgi:spore germination cell wall hydrolase CwlJ-like protein